MVLRVFDRNRVRFAWKYSANGTIWRLLPCESGVFVGETRDSERKQAGFFCLDQKSGRILWEGVQSDEPWWVGIEAVHDDRVFLHGYSTPDLPEHKGIIALDLISGRVVWQQRDLRFVRCVDDSLFASRDELDGRLLLQLNPHSGDVIQTCDKESLEIQRSHLHAHPIEMPEFPAPLEGFDLFDENTIGLVHRHCTMDDIVGRIEALKKDNILLFSCYERADSGGRGPLINVLRVLDLEKEDVVFAETLCDGVLSPASDTFFVRDRMLYFIQDRSSLAAVRVDDFIH